METPNSFQLEPNSGEILVLGVADVGLSLGLEELFKGGKESVNF